MIDGNRQQVWTARAPFGPETHFGVLACVLLVALSVTAYVLFANVLLSIGVFILTAGVALQGMVLHHPHRALGLGNGVTLIRAAMVALLTAAIVDPAPSSWIVFFIACIAFALDGLDGWLARRSGLTSAFGARFDMEVDALLGAVLALILLSQGHVGPEILVLGFSRYVFVAAAVFLPKLNGALPDSMRRKTVCVIQIACLIALLCPITPVWLMHPMSWGAAGLLLWSFAVDIRWLLGRA